MPRCPLHCSAASPARWKSLLPWNLAVLAGLLYARWTVHVHWNLYARGLRTRLHARWTAPLLPLRVLAGIPRVRLFLLGSVVHLDALLV